MVDRKGNIYEFTQHDGDKRFESGTIVVLTEDDGTANPYFEIITGNWVSRRKDRCLTVSELRQLWPDFEEPKSTETIDLMGHTYNKEELEEALKNVEEL